MIFVKLVALLFLSAYGYSMGQHSDLNGFGKLMVGVSFITIPLLYLLPTIEAFQRDKTNATSVALVNVLLGWTLLGWVVALVWSLQDSSPTTVVLQDAPSPAGDTKVCPFCAETVKLAAKVCRHCQRDLPEAPVKAKFDVEANPYDNYQVTMDHYGITFRLEKFWFDKKPFEQLDDAVNYARLNPV